MTTREQGRRAVRSLTTALAVAGVIGAGGLGAAAYTGIQAARADRSSGATTTTTDGSSSGSSSAGDDAGSSGDGGSASSSSSSSGLSAGSGPSQTGSSGS